MRRDLCSGFQCIAPNIGDSIAQTGVAVAMTALPESLRMTEVDSSLAEDAVALVADPAGHLAKALVRLARGAEASVVVANACLTAA